MYFVFQVKEPTDTIVLNCVDLNVDKVVVNHSGTNQEPVSATVANDVETLTLKFSSPVPAGKAFLSLEFTGEMNDKMKGLYRSKYTRWV